VKANEYVSPGPKPAESKAPVVLVTVCNVDPLLVHVTVTPTGTTSDEGSKKLSPTLTSAPTWAAGAALATRLEASNAAPANAASDTRAKRQQAAGTIAPAACINTLCCVIS
jgi:hypothetical protein